MRTIRMIAGLLLVAGVTACSDGSVAPVESPRAAAIAIVGGDGQEGMTYNGAQIQIRDAALPDSLRVRVTDAAGTPVPGARVVWTTDAGGLEPAASTTDADGIAAARWTWERPGSGAVPAGTYTAVAQLPGVDFVTFTGHARVGLQLRALEILPSTVDLAAGPAEVRVRISVVDDREAGGMEYGQFLFISPPGVAHPALGLAFALASGTPRNGVYEGSIVVAEDTPSGDWPLVVTLGWGCGPANRSDWSGRLAQLGLPTRLHIKGGASASRGGALATAAPSGGPALQLTQCAAAGSAAPRLSPPAHVDGGR